jgi:hypothetical protein
MRSLFSISEFTAIVHCVAVLLPAITKEAVVTGLLLVCSRELQVCLTSHFRRRVSEFFALLAANRYAKSSNTRNVSQLVLVSCGFLGSGRWAQPFGGTYHLHLQVSPCVLSSAFVQAGDSHSLPKGKVAMTNLP